MDASLAEFEAKGLNGARMDDIAAAAGLSKGSIYRYFPDKNQLFAETVTGAITDCLTHHGPIGTRDPEAYLRKLWAIAGDSRLRAAYRLSLIPSAEASGLSDNVLALLEVGLVKPFAAFLGQREREATLLSGDDALTRARLVVATILGAHHLGENAPESQPYGIAFLLRACELEAPSPQADGF